MEQQTSTTPITQPDQKTNPKKPLSKTYIIFLVLISLLLLTIIILLLVLILKPSDKSSNSTNTTNTSTVTTTITSSATTSPTTSATITTTATNNPTSTPTKAPNYEKIKTVDFKTLLNADIVNGDSYLEAKYADLTGDGYLDGIFGFKVAGTGGYMSVYVYSYTDADVKPVNLFKLEGVSKGSFDITSDNRIKISETEQGLSGSTTISYYKWDNSSKTFKKQ